MGRKSLSAKEKAVQLINIYEVIIIFVNFQIFGCLLVFITACDLVKGAIDLSEGTKPAVYVVTPVILLTTLVSIYHNYILTLF